MFLKCYTAYSTQSKGTNASSTNFPKQKEAGFEQKLEGTLAHGAHLETLLHLFLGDGYCCFRSGSRSPVLRFHNYLKTAIQVGCDKGVCVIIPVRHKLPMRTTTAAVCDKGTAGVTVRVIDEQVTSTCTHVPSTRRCHGTRAQRNQQVVRMLMLGFHFGHVVVEIVAMESVLRFLWVDLVGLDIVSTALPVYRHCCHCTGWPRLDRNRQMSRWERRAPPSSGGGSRDRELLLLLLLVKATSAAHLETRQSADPGHRRRGMTFGTDSASVAASAVVFVGTTTC